MWRYGSSIYPYPIPLTKFILICWDDSNLQLTWQRRIPERIYHSQSESIFPNSDQAGHGGVEAGGRERCRHKRDRLGLGACAGNAFGIDREFLRNAVFNLVDMAGLSRPSHPIEKKGVEKGRGIARERRSRNGW